MPDSPNGRGSRAAAILIVAAAAVIGATMLTIVLWRRDHLVVDENQLVEWAQVGFLLLAALAHGARIASAPDRAGRAIRLGMTLLCLSLVVREVDIDELWRPEIMGPVNDGLRGALVVAWLALGWWGRRAIKPLWSARRALLFSGFTLLTGLACGLYLASWPFDKNVLELEGGLHMLIEEVLQLNATVLFFFGALNPLLGAGPSGEDRAD